MSIFRLCLLMLLLSGSMLAIAQNELKIQPLKMSNEQLKIIAQGMNVSREQLLLDSKTIKTFDDYLGAQVTALEKLKSSLEKNLEKSLEKDRLLAILQAELDYAKGYRVLVQTRIKQLTMLNASLIKPEAIPMAPYTPLPFSVLKKVGWAEGGQEVYEDTANGGHFVQIEEGQIERYSGNYMDEKSKLHDAQQEEDQLPYWKRGAISDSYESSGNIFENVQQLSNAAMQRPNDPWFKIVKPAVTTEPAPVPEP